MAIMAVGGEFIMKYLVGKRFFNAYKDGRSPCCAPHRGALDAVLLLSRGKVFCCLLLRTIILRDFVAR
jgi:hypothetical protein